MTFSPMLDLKQFFPRQWLNPYIAKKKSHWLLESAVISISNHIPQRPEFQQISPNLANIILHENNIKIAKWIKDFNKRQNFFFYSTSIFLIFFLIRYPSVVKFFLTKQDMPKPPQHTYHSFPF